MKGKENLSAEALPPSKSQQRREALELKHLASTLIGLASSQLGRLALDDDVREAIIEARAIRSNVARKRQLQYVAKLLRRIDPEPILLALEAFEGEARQLTGRQHRCESWRDRLLERGDPAIGELIRQRGDVDTQSLRQLVRNAAKEAKLGKPPASARSLFRALRDMDEQRPLPALPNS